MDSTTAWFLVTCAAIAGAFTLVRTRAARTGSGVLAQRRFRALHGARVARLLRGEADPRRGSPWIMVHVDDRPARMVAAPIPPHGRMQAGIELHGWTLPVNVWHTTGSKDEVELADGISFADVEPLVAELRAADVDSLASADLVAGAPHLLRMQFDAVDELPERLETVAQVLRRLEALGERTG